MVSLSTLETAAAIELAERKRMALRLFRPQKHQEDLFQVPRAKLTLVQGGNRSGKSTCAAVIFAAIATDTPITLSDGTECDLRMPWQKGKCLRMYVVGLDQKHIGQTIYRLLFKRGLFKVVHDPKTKELRSYNPDTDKGVRPKDSPPLIPARFIKSVAWESKADSIFSKVVIHDPRTKEEIAEIYAFTSQGIPKAGDPVDEVWVDEKIVLDGYIDEMKARLVDKNGRLMWSSWPDTASEDLTKFVNVIDREIEAGRTDMARKVVFTMSSNKHLGKKAIEEFLAGCATPEEAAARDKGIFITEFLRMYPNFDKHYHTAIIDGADEDQLSKVLRARDGLPPNEWTKWLILDPGTSHPAVLLCSVPPPELGNYYVPYQEFYPGAATADQIAQLVRKETHGQYFHQFIIDRRAGRRKPEGRSDRTIDCYNDAFRDAGMTCAIGSGRFTMGSDNVGGRQMLVQRWMEPQENGLPKLRIVTHRCPSLCKQLEKVKKAVVQKEVKDERKAPNQQHDVVDALEYFAAAGPRYVLPKPQLAAMPSAYQRYISRFGSGAKEEESISIGTYY